jgi:hypothetical protein
VRELLSCHNHDGVQMAGWGIVAFLSEPFNVFDFVVVAVSIVELAIVAGSDSGGGSNLSALRMFRMLRILKAFRVLRMARMFRCDVFHCYYHLAVSTVYYTPELYPSGIWLCCTQTQATSKLSAAQCERRVS